MARQTDGARRRALIAQAHLAARQAGCVSKEDRRAIQQMVTGKASCAEMTERELVLLIDHWGRMGADVRAAAPRVANAPGMATRWQLATIERLAWELGWEEGLDDARLLRFVQRTAKVDLVRWLDRAAASRVISGLIRWKRQRQAKGVQA
jgi:phage gp16-like protein